MSEFTEYPSLLKVVSAGPVCCTEGMTKLNPTAKDWTTVVVAQILKNFSCQLQHLLKNQKTKKKRVFCPVMCWTLSTHIFTQFSVFESKKKVKNWLRYGQKHFYMQLKCMSLPFSPYLSQILTKLLENWTNLQGIRISIHLCNLCEIILLLFGTINSTTKDWLQPVWTSFLVLWTD